MKKYKIIYWLNGDKLKIEIKAENMQQARVIFYLEIKGDIVSVEEVKE